MHGLLIDRRWLQAPFLSAMLTRSGFKVTVVSSAKWFRLDRRIDYVHTTDFGVHSLARIINESAADIVMPLTDDLIERMWALPSSLTHKVLPNVDAEQRDLLRDRRALYDLVASVGVNVPERIDVVTEETLSAAVDQLGFPLVVRGTRGTAGSQVRIVHSFCELIPAFNSIVSLSPGGAFLQRFVEGRRCLIGALCKDGKMLQSFAQTALATYPPQTGPMTAVRPIDSPALRSSAERIFAAMRWTGLLSADFIEDQSGAMHFLEVNPRPWGSIQAAHICGVPFVQSFARLMQGGEQYSGAVVDVTRRVTLFPQYMIAIKHTKGALRSPREWLHVLHALRDVPWTMPILVLQNIAQIIRE